MRLWCPSLATKLGDHTASLSRPPPSPVDDRIRHRRARLMGTVRARADGGPGPPVDGQASACTSSSRASSAAGCTRPASPTTWCSTTPAVSSPSTRRPTAMSTLPMPWDSTSGRWCGASGGSGTNAGSVPRASRSGPPTTSPAGSWASTWPGSTTPCWPTRPRTWRSSATTPRPSTSRPRSGAARPCSSTTGRPCPSTTWC